MAAPEWGAAFGPFDDDGNRIPYDQLPTTKALRRGLPTIGNFTIRSVTGTEHEIEVSALPIVAEGGQEGAMGFFWPRTSGGEVG